MSPQPFLWPVSRSLIYFVGPLPLSLSMHFLMLFILRLIDNRLLFARYFRHVRALLVELIEILRIFVNFLIVTLQRYRIASGFKALLPFSELRKMSTTDKSFIVGCLYLLVCLLRFRIVHWRQLRYSALTFYSLLQTLRCSDFVLRQLFSNNGD
jgi:hypothetical protein